MKRLLMFFILVCFAAAFPVGAAQSAPPQGAGGNVNHDSLAVATFAGGCFWCVESDFVHIPGVVQVTSGYAGGKEANPTYKQVSAGLTGHLESVQLRYDPAKVSYRQLVEWFWRHHDPTDAGGQFCDRGNQYRSAIFVHTEEQRREAEDSKKRIVDQKLLGNKPVVTPIVTYTTFYPAEEYHQRYFEKNPVRYKFYRFNCGRDKTLEGIWGSEATRPFSAYTASAVAPGAWHKPSREQLKAKLTPMQFKVTQEEGTEPPFKNEYADNHREGIYVDLLSGEALYSSKDKYESGTGWPSFTRPLEPGNIVTREDRSLFSVRTEVRSRLGDNHLGHVFDDGPKPTGLRYCMNSAALRFIPKENLEKEGYGKYLGLFK